MNDDLMIRAAISSSIRRCHKSREQIAEEMSRLLQTRVTAPMLNTYSAGSTSLNRLPAAWMRAFCQAVGNDALLHSVAEAAGYQLISGDEVKLLSLAKCRMQIKRSQQEARRIEKGLLAEVRP